MPRKYRKKVRTKRKSTVATLARLNRVSTSPLLGFPRQRRIMMKYCDYQNMTTTSGSMVYLDYLANSAFDPFRPTGGHQAFGFDQYMAMYNHFHVESSVIKLSIVNTGAKPVVCGVYLADDSTLPYGNWYTYAETNRGQQKVINFATSQDKAVTATSNFNHKSFFNGRPVGDSSFVGSISANPEELAHYMVYLQSFNQTDSSSITVKVEILYQIVFSEPRDIASS
jgi:hypothetical protein